MLFSTLWWDRIRHPYFDFLYHHNFQIGKKAAYALDTS
jgi:hypothetical protein